MLSIKEVSNDLTLFGIKECIYRFIWYRLTTAHSLVSWEAMIRPVHP